MRVSLCGILLLPICAAFTSLDCVHKCLTDPILALLPSEDEIRGMAQRGMDGDFSLPREYRNMTEHQLACSVLNEVVPCLEECDAREPSNQQAYFKQTLGNLHRVVCSTPETFFQYALPLWSEVVQCYEGQLSEDYALTVFGALMVSGGVEGVNEDTNLCYVASSVARVLVNNNCNRDVKRVVVSAVEFLYRFAALELGMHNVPTTDQPRLDGTCEDFSYFVDEGAPLRRLSRENEWQEQISTPFKQFAQKVNGSYVETATQCMQGCLRLHADNLLNNENIFADPCESLRSLMKKMRQPLSFKKASESSQ